MKHLTRFLLSCCLVALALVFTACAPAATATPAPTATTAAPTTVPATAAPTTEVPAATMAATEAPVMAATDVAMPAATMAATEAAMAPATMAATMAPATMAATTAVVVPAAGGIKIGVVTDVGQIDDRSFNQSAWEGAEAAAKDLGGTAKYLVPSGPEDYAGNIQAFADQGYNVIVTVGFALGDATAAAAAKYPKIKFIAVDAFQGTETANVTGLIFPEDQSGFLAGVLAARLTKTGTIAAVLGTDQVPPVVRFKEGYEAGAKYTKPDIKIISTYYPGGLDKAFNDPAWGATTAGQAMDSGADIVFGAGGKTGNGALQEVAKRTTKDKPLYCIGVDTDQWLTLPEAHPCLVSSAQKLIVPGVSGLIKQAADGTIKGGNFVGTVALAPFHDLTSAVPADVAKELESLKADLDSGAIKLVAEAGSPKLTVTTKGGAAAPAATMAATDVAMPAATMAATMAVEAPAATMAATMAPVAATMAATTAVVVPAAGGIKIGVVTDVGQIDDRSFNQSAWEGAEAAAKDLGGTAKYLVPSGPEDYAGNIQAFADQGYNVIVTVGFALGDATAAAAAKYPKIKFIAVDAFQGTETANVTGLIFPEDQSGFLAGVLAARLTKTGTIAAVLGTDQVPPVVRFKEGYEAGAKYTKPDIKIISTYYPGGLDKAFNDPAWGATTAGQAMDSGADIVFGAGGKTGNGALQEVAKRTTKDKPLYCIGVDTDQWLTLPEAHPCLVSSAQKLIVPGVSGLIKQAADGTIKGGNFVGTVALAPFHDLTSAVPADVAKELESLKADLDSGAIKLVAEAGSPKLTVTKAGAAAPAATMAATDAAMAPAATMAPTAAMMAATDAAMPAATMASTDSAAAAPASGNLVVGFVLVGPKTDKGWSEAHYEASEYLKAKVPGVTTKVIEALDPNVTLAQIVQNLKDEGAKLIFTTSDFFQDDTTALAKANPDITFINISGDAVHKGDAPANLGNIMGRMEYTKMIAGCAAALTTQTKKISYLGPLIIPETRRLSASAYLGAKYCYTKYRGGSDADLKFDVKWIGFWFNQPGQTLDPTEVTNGFYDAGSDVVLSGIDSTEAIVVAKQRVDKGQKVYAIPYDFKGACDLGPSACLGVPYFNWGPAYVKLVTAFKAGTWKPSWDWNGPDWTDINNPDTSAVGFLPGPALPADQKTNLDAFIKDLASGSVNLFKGPMKYQSGKEFLADGKAATDDEIWYMPELLEGMVGESQPKK
ncbi:MAG: BMP family ABC transporter substrate-binding protein [Chloroflexota bacterium]